MVIEGTHLPGRTFCSPDGSSLNDVHVGIQIKSEVRDLIPGDAASASWEFDILVLTDTEGHLDFRGPAVHGKRGERFLYLSWGNLTLGHFVMFRRAKLMLTRIDQPTVLAAHTGQRSLVGIIQLTDQKGSPRCARVDPPHLQWLVR